MLTVSCFDGKSYASQKTRLPLGKGPVSFSLAHVHGGGGRSVKPGVKKVSAMS